MGGSNHYSKHLSNPNRCRRQCPLHRGCPLVGGSIIYRSFHCILLLILIGTTVLNVRARGTGGRVIVYGIDLPSGIEGVFTIDPAVGNITVGPNGTSRLVIRDHNPTIFMFDAFAYYLTSGQNGNRVRSLMLITNKI